MEVTICKEFTFEAAHKLPNHSGKCRNFHGHTYTLKVYASGPIHESDGSSNEGMVLDFGDISLIYHEHLESFLDHRYLNKTINPLPTAEIIALWCLAVFMEHIPQVHKVRVYEGLTSYAEAKV